MLVVVSGDILACLPEWSVVPALKILQKRQLFCPRRLVDRSFKENGMVVRAKIERAKHVASAVCNIFDGIDGSFTSKFRRGEQNKRRFMIFPSHVHTSILT